MPGLKNSAAFKERMDVKTREGASRVRIAALIAIVAAVVVVIAKRI